MGSNKKYTCMRCDSEIKTIVEKCLTCDLYFHPCCVKFHKVSDDNNMNSNKKIKCSGPYEKMELRQLGKNNMNTNSSNLPIRRSIGIPSPSSGYSRSSTTPVDKGKKLKDNTEEIVANLRKKYEEDFCILKQFIVELVKKEILEIKTSLTAMVKTELNKSISEISNNISYDKIYEDMTEKIAQVIKTEINTLKAECSSSSSNTNKGNSGNNNTTTNNNHKNAIPYKYKQYDNRSTERIIIKPKIKQPSETTVQHIKNNINVGVLGIGINKIRNGSNGKVIVDLEKETDKTKLTKEINEKLGNSVDVTDVNKKRPKLKIINITQDIFSMEEGNIIDNIMRQNKLMNFDKEKDMKIIKKYMKNQDGGSMIMEVHPRTHKLLLDSGRIKIGWMNFKIYNFIDVNRCFNCWGYKHKAVNCKRTVVCRRCAGQHSETDCTNNNKKCNNCVNWSRKLNITDWDVNHEATDPNCKIYVKMINSEANRTVHESWDN